MYSVPKFFANGITLNDKKEDVDVEVLKVSRFLVCPARERMLFDSFGVLSRR